MKGKSFIEPLFNGVINGTVSQFVEIMKPQPDSSIYRLPGRTEYFFGRCEENNFTDTVISPRYQVGEKVYLKELYYIDDQPAVYYKYSGHSTNSGGKFQNKLFMPAKYARYFIEITGVRCERLQNISDEDCLKEGVEESNQKGVFFSNAVQFGGARSGICKIFESPQLAYAALIDQINGNGTWESNPYVWVYDFKLVNK
jgi:hypothetical protein